MTIYLIGGAVVLLLLSRRGAAGAPPPGPEPGIPSAQNYNRDPSLAFSSGAPFSTAGTPFGAPPAVPGNVPILPTAAPPPIFQSVSAQASASFSGSYAPTLETRTGLGHFVNTTPTSLDRRGRGAF